MRIALMIVLAAAPVAYPFTQHAGDPKHVALQLPADGGIPEGAAGLKWGASLDEVRAAYPAAFMEPPIEPYVVLS